MLSDWPTALATLSRVCTVITKGATDSASERVHVTYRPILNTQLWPENYPEQANFKLSMSIQSVYLTIGILNNQDVSITSYYHTTTAHKVPKMVPWKISIQHMIASNALEAFD